MIYENVLWVWVFLFLEKCKVIINPALILSPPLVFGRALKLLCPTDLALLGVVRKTAWDFSADANWVFRKWLRCSKRVEKGEGRGREAWSFVLFFSSEIQHLQNFNFIPKFLKTLQSSRLGSLLRPGQH
jgi:hypothetical protein